MSPPTVRRSLISLLIRASVSANCAPQLGSHEPLPRMKARVKNFCPVAPLDAVHASETLDEVVPVTCSPVGVGGGLPVLAEVVTEIAAVFADSPAELVAETENWYVVDGDSPETVAVVPPTDATFV